MHPLRIAKPIFCALLMVLTITVQAQQSEQIFDGKTWWGYVKVLADDNMEGRETGSDSLRRAQAYVVERFKETGVKPAGTKGFYQPVKFVQREIIEKDSSAMLVNDGHELPLVLGEDAYFSTRVELAPEVNAPLVFAGYGLKIPEKNYDDLAGLDLKGKVAVIVSGSPADIPTTLSSHYQTAVERWNPFHAAGAVGNIAIPNPASMDIPWSRMSLNRAHPSMELADAEFHETPGENLAMTFNPANAEKLFAGSGHTFQEIATLAKDRKALPSFVLPSSIKTQVHVENKVLESDNLVAVLPGTDPVLKNQYVVLSAHIDHVGIGQPINGDRIYNGAMDNAAGVAALLDLAASFKIHPEKLKRSVLFVIVTAEEKGLLGSKYFAAHPTVDAKSIVADINTDMFLPIVPLKVLKVQGIAESTLGEEAARIAQSMGVKPVPDPQSLRNSFIRSDQYSFIRQGIPAVVLDVEAEPGSPEAKIFKDWLTNRYHAPSDDLNQPVDLGAAALFEQIMRTLTVSTANAAARPEWKSDSFFRRYSH
jgi:Zn-dependent M28 family amino/carboxypeptidase